MKGITTGRGLYQKGRLIDSGGAVSFPSIADMWFEMQRANYYNYQKKKGLRCLYDIH